MLVSWLCLCCGSRLPPFGHCRLPFHIFHLEWTAPATAASHLPATAASRSPATAASRSPATATSHSPAMPSRFVSGFTVGLMESSPKPGSPRAQEPRPQLQPRPSPEETKTPLFRHRSSTDYFVFGRCYYSSSPGDCRFPCPTRSNCIAIGTELETLYFPRNKPIYRIRSVWGSSSPAAAAATGDQYCQEVLHHLTGMQFFKIKGHLTRVFFGTLGTGYNTWSQHAGVGRLGILLNSQGVGTGDAHVDLLVMTAGIFKYP